MLCRIILTGVSLFRLFFEEFRGQIDNNMVNICHKMMQVWLNVGPTDLYLARLAPPPSHSLWSGIELPAAVGCPAAVGLSTRPTGVSSSSTEEGDWQ